MTSVELPGMQNAVDQQPRPDMAGLSVATNTLQHQPAALEAILRCVGCHDARQEPATAQAVSACLGRRYNVTLRAFNRLTDVQVLDRNRVVADNNGGTSIVGRLCFTTSSQYAAYIPKHQPEGCMAPQKDPGLYKIEPAADRRVPSDLRPAAENTKALLGAGRTTDSSTRSLACVACHIARNKTVTVPSVAGCTGSDRNTSRTALNRLVDRKLMNPAGVVPGRGSPVGYEPSGPGRETILHFLPEGYPEGCKTVSITEESEELREASMIQAAPQDVLRCIACHVSRDRLITPGLIVACTLRERSGLTRNITGLKDRGMLKDRGALWAVGRNGLNPAAYGPTEAGEKVLLNILSSHGRLDTCVAGRPDNNMPDFIATKLEELGILPDLQPRVAVMMRCIGHMILEGRRPAAAAIEEAAQVTRMSALGTLERFTRLGLITRDGFETGIGGPSNAYRVTSRGAGIFQLLASSEGTYGNA